MRERPGCILFTGKEGTGKVMSTGLLTTASRTGRRFSQWTSFAVLTWLTLAGTGCGGPRKPGEETLVCDLLELFSSGEAEVLKSSETGVAAAVAPKVNPERRGLFVPFGTEIQIALDLPAWSVLVTSGTKGRGSAVGRLEITWTPDGEATQVLSQDFSAVAERRTCVGNRKRETGRLSLKAINGVPSQHPAAGMLMTQPHIVAGARCEPHRDRGGGDVPTRDRVNIIVYLIDALRADHLGCYGYDRAVSPNIDRFAESSVLFENAQAQSSWTRTSVASLFTGLWPQQHATNDKEDVLPEEAETLAEILAGGGYRTAGIVANGNVSSIYGIGQGFSYYKYIESARPNQIVARSTDVADAVEVWLDQQDERQPFFLYIHTVDPHLPYEPPQPYRSLFANSVNDRDLGSAERVHHLNDDPAAITPELISDLLDLYDGEIAANDQSFGRLIEDLKARGLYDSSVIILVSDHGEEFYDHRGWTHGNTLHTEVMDIPMIVRRPFGSESFRIPEIVDHVDMFTTIIDLAGLQVPGPIQGRSFAHLVDGRRAVGWENRSVGYLDLKERFSVSLLNPEWKLILRRNKNGELVPGLYDRFADRGEKHDLSGDRPDVVDELKARLSGFEGEAAGGLENTKIEEGLDSETRDQLRALGYH